ncbi:hypothetical protein C7974DRAFT_401282, partial [Boeremia exigua]|uniref:uncharacterized protein n=1 Tax=Boeremia exigua TaxID=749465 RepID=UPI001E8D9F23
MPATLKRKGTATVLRAGQKRARADRSADEGADDDVPLIASRRLSVQNRVDSGVAGTPSPRSPTPGSNLLLLAGPFADQLLQQSPTFAGWRDANSDLTDRTTELEQKWEGDEEDRRSLRREVRSLEGQLNAESRRLSNDHTQLKKDVGAKTTAHENAMREEKERLKKVIAGLERKIETDEAAIARLQAAEKKDHDMRAKEITEKQKNDGDMQAARQEYINFTERLQQHIQDEVERQIGPALADFNQQATEIRNLKHTNTQLQTTIQGLQTKTQAWQTKFAKLEQRCNDHAEENIECRQATTENGNDISLMKAGHVENFKKLSRRMSRCEEKEDVQGYQEAVEVLQRTSDDTATGLNNLRRETDELKAEGRKAAEQLGALSGEIQHVKTKQDELHTRVDTLSQMLNANIVASQNILKTMASAESERQQQVCDVVAVLTRSAEPPQPFS